MYLERIIVKGFRLFKYLDLTLNPGLNVLVGANDSGKTSLIDAIRVVLGSNSSEQIYISERDFYDNSKTIEIQLKFANIDNYAHRFLQHVSYEGESSGGESSGGESSGGESKNKKIALYVNFTAQKTGKERRGYPDFEIRRHSGFDGQGPTLETEVREFLTATYLKPLRDAEGELSSGRSSRLSQILNSSQDIRKDMNIILKIIADANDALLDPTIALKKSADEIRDKFLYNLIFESDKKKLGVYIDIAGLQNKDLTVINESEKRRHLRTVLEGLNLNLSDDKKVHGLGYHNLLFMATELLLLERGVGNEFPLLLIEEPEAHLHPQLQMKLLQFIKWKVNSDESPNGIQCLLTTNSNILSSKVVISDIIMLERGNAWPLRLEETEMDEKDELYLRKFLDSTKANLFFAKSLLLVEGDAELILLPILAELLGCPFENYGVSIIKYENSWSWRRFVKIFLRKGQDDSKEAWTNTRVCVLRDLDLWPESARKDDSNPYGFLETKDGNEKYWLKNNNPEKKKQELKEEFERQNVRIEVSDEWTFEFCLAKSGLFEECYEALDEGDKSQIVNIKGDDDDKATYIQSKVSKTDFAYQLGEVLTQQRKEFVDKMLSAQNNTGSEKVRSDAIKKFAEELRPRLPPYIVRAIEYVTPIINESSLETKEREETENDKSD